LELLFVVFLFRASSLLTIPTVVEGQLALEQGRTERKRENHRYKPVPPSHLIYSCVLGSSSSSISAIAPPCCPSVTLVAAAPPPSSCVATGVTSCSILLLLLFAAKADDGESSTRAIATSLRFEEGTGGLGVREERALESCSGSSVPAAPAWLSVWFSESWSSRRRFGGTAERASLEEDWIKVAEGMKGALEKGGITEADVDAAAEAKEGALDSGAEARGPMLACRSCWEEGVGRGRRRGGGELARSELEVVNGWAGRGRCARLGTARGAAEVEEAAAGEKVAFSESAGVKRGEWTVVETCART
jgi:hypothetical protein